jgi:hypothetical protein
MRAMGYPNPYPVTSTQPPPSQSAEQRFASTNIPSAASYYNLQAIALAATSYGSSDHQSNRYSQQGVSSSAMSFNWYSNSTSEAPGGQGTESMGDATVPQRMPDGLPNFGMRSSIQQLYNTAELAALTHASTLEHNMNQNAGNRGRIFGSNGYSSITTNNGASGQIQYQGLTSQNYGYLRTTSDTSGTQSQRCAPTDQATQQTSSSITPIFSATYSQVQPNTYSTNTAVLGSNSVTTTRKQDSTISSQRGILMSRYGSPYTFAPAGPSGSQIPHKQINH